MIREHPINFDSDAPRDTFTLQSWHPGLSQPTHGVKVEIHGPADKVSKYLRASANHDVFDAASTLYPIVIPSAGRARNAHLNMDAAHVDLGGSDVFIAIEPHQYDSYAEAWPNHLLLVLPESDKAMHKL
jgi:hypothetical protein